MREDNLAIVRAGYEAFAKGDVDTMRTIYTSDVVWHTPGIFPFEADYKGVDAVVSYLTKLFEMTDGDIRVEPEYMFADEHRVVVMQHVTASRHGQHLDLRDVLVCEIRDGKQAAVTQFEVDVKALESFWG